MLKSPALSKPCYYGAGPFSVWLRRLVWVSYRSCSKNSNCLKTSSKYWQFCSSETCKILYWKEKKKIQVFQVCLYIFGIEPEQDPEPELPSNFGSGSTQWRPDPTVSGSTTLAETGNVEWLKLHKDHHQPCNGSVNIQNKMYKITAMYVVIHNVHRRLCVQYICTVRYAVQVHLVHSIVFI